MYRSTRDLQGHESELKDQQAELKKGLEEKREKHREFKVQKDLLSEGKSCSGRFGYCSFSYRNCWSQGKSGHFPIINFCFAFCFLVSIISTLP